MTALGRFTRCLTKRSNSSLRLICVEAVGKSVTLRDKRGIRRNIVDGSFGSGDALGKIIASLIWRKTQGVNGK